MYTWEELIRLYRLTVPKVPSNLQPRYNICPTTEIDVVVEKAGERTLEPMRWGLVPAWWKKPLKEFKLATFNAKAEDVTDQVVRLYPNARGLEMFPKGDKFEVLFLSPRPADC